MNRYTYRRLLALCLLVLLALGVGSAVSFLARLVDKPHFTCSADRVTVLRGDTLWNTARHYCKGDTSAVIDILVQMYGTNIRVGQTIDLPVDR